MRIVHVIDSEGMYGAEVVVLNLIEAQRAAGHRSSLLSLGGIGTSQKQIELEALKRDLDVRALRFRDGINIRGALTILAHARQLDAQVIHSHGYKSDILLGIIPRNYRRIPVLSTLHGWTSTSICSKIWLYETLQALMATTLDRVVAVSARIQEQRRLRMFGVKPVIVNNGIPILDFTGGEPWARLPHLPDHRKRGWKIISVGRLSPEKGFAVLIEAIGRVTVRGTNISLVLVGDGPEATALKRAAERARVADRVFLTGYREKAYRFIPDFDLFVLPSFSEGSPITLLEAMQAGVPILATSVGEIPRLLDYGNLGRLVEPRDPAVLAKALIEIFGNINEARQKASQAKETAIREYSLMRTAERYIALYKEIVSAGCAA